MRDQLIQPVKGRYEEYLMDESKFCGQADTISFPNSEEEVVQVVQEMKAQGVPITIQGGKTGIVGGSIPQGGHLMNLSRLGRVVDHGTKEDGTAWITVEAGMPLMELKKEITSAFHSNDWYCPAEPTEPTATVGGVAATGAQGIQAFYYGGSGQYILAFRMVQADGTVLELHREQDSAQMDEILGGEGLAGVITQVTLQLVKKPASVWGITFFFETTHDVCQFAQRISQRELRGEEAAVSAVEYLDRSTIDMIESRKPMMTKIKEIPDVDPQYEGMVYLEIQGQEDGVEALAEELMEDAMECGSDPDVAWALSGENEVEKMHAYRHAAAEISNLRIEELRREDPVITKLATDMEFPHGELEELLTLYRKGLEETGLEGCIFGHLPKCHLHINLFPKNGAEYETGVQLLRTWGKECLARGGSPIGEHGVGKLKRRIYGEDIPSCYVEHGKQLKQTYDPEGLFNQGNIWA